MSQQLSGKIAIVTGGVGGLGQASVRRLLEEGAKVVIADWDAERGEELARALGSSARFLRTDVADVDQVQALVDFTVAEFGGLDILFNNAGVSQATFSRFVDDDLQDFQKVININLLGVMIGSQRAARYMKEHGGGVIINNASIGGHLAGFGVISYRAAKAAVIHFTRCVAIDFAEYGIRVNCVSPSNIQTGISAFPAPGMSQEQIRLVNEAILPIRLAGQPLKRPGTPEDVANTVVFLASDQSAQITGQEILVDGGAAAGDPVNRLEEIMRARAEVLKDPG